MCGRKCGDVGLDSGRALVLLWFSSLEPFFVLLKPLQICLKRRKRCLGKKCVIARCSQPRHSALVLGDHLLRFLDMALNCAEEIISIRHGGRGEICRRSLWPSRCR